MFSWKEGNRRWKRRGATCHWFNTRSGREARMTERTMATALVQVLNMFDAANMRDCITNIRLRVTTGPNKSADVAPPEGDIWAWFDATPAGKLAAHSIERRRAKSRQ